MRNRTRPPARRPERRQLGPQGAQKRQPGFAVVDIPGPILHAQDVGGLGQVRQDRVVAGHLAVMRVEPAEGPLDLQPGRDHHAVHIDRPGAQAQRPHHAGDHRRVDLLQPVDRGHGEGLQPATHRARRRQDLHLTEAPDQRIIVEEGEVPQPPAAHHEQPDHQAHHRRRAEVAPAAGAGERLTNHGVEAGRAQVAAEQLQPGIRGECDIGELQGQIAIDTRGQIGSSSSHGRWPFVVGRTGWITPPFNHNGRPFSMTNCRARPGEMSH